MKKNIKFVYFDVGGVMFHWRQIIEKIAVRHGKKVEEVKSVFQKYDEVLCKGLITSQDFWKKIHKDLNLQKEKDLDFALFSMQTFTPIKETHRLVRKISQQLPTGIISNIHHGTFELSVKYGHIPDLKYAVIIKSCEIGLMKPEKQIFEYAQKKAKVAPKEILFIDDLEINIRAAASSGWNSLLFETNNPQKSLKKIKELIGIE